MIAASSLSRFTDEQIISILKEADAGVRTKELARKYGVSEHTIYGWKAKLIESWRDDYNSIRPHTSL